MVNKEINILKFDYIDALRGLAVFSVFLTHLRQHVNVPFETLDRIFILGQHGVQLFFLVSAFTLCMSIEARDTLNNRLEVNKFFLRRFFRIAPLYYFAILIYSLKILFIPISNFPNDLPLNAIILNIFFLHGFSREFISSIPPGGWSIAIEIMFYLILPTLLKRITSLRKSFIWFFYIFLFSLIFKFFGRFYISNYSSGGINNLIAEEGWFFYFWFPNQISVFMLGVIGYFLIKERAVFLKKASFILLVPAAFFSFLSYYIMFNHNAHLWYPTHLILSIGFLNILLFLHFCPLRIIVNPFWVFMGKISYGVYLFHFIIFLFFDKLNSKVYNLSSLTYSLLSFLVTILVAYVGYISIEKWGIEFGKKLIKKLH